jgi:aminomethyltransferase
MPLFTPFYARTRELCTSSAYKIWSGFLAPRHYGPNATLEYHALRHACGVLDLAPLRKLRVEGPDAAQFLSLVFTRDVTRATPGRVLYGCFLNTHGLLIDDGTVMHLPDGGYRVTSGSSLLPWFTSLAHGFEIQLVDESDAIACLALQGPTSRALLGKLFGSRLELLSFFRIATFRLGEAELQISRTGYTGDLGYELWIPQMHAIALWDAIFEEGRHDGCTPLGLDALDIARIEAGFIMQDVEYQSAPRAETPLQTATPVELGLSAMVQWDRGPFVGDRALRKLMDRPPARVLVGMEVDELALAEHYRSRGLPPLLPAEASRTPAPLFHHGREAGHLSSRAWSPLLKKYLALAWVAQEHSKVGTRLDVELLVDHSHVTVGTTVVDRPFFQPKRFRA